MAVEDKQNAERKMSAQLLEKLSDARYTALKVFPYLSDIVTILVFRPVPGVGTMRVSMRAVVEFDPEFVASQRREALAADLVHEAMHVYLHHGPRCGSKDPEEWNAAGDRAINSGIRASSLPLQSWALAASDIGAPDGLTANDYYDLAMKNPAPKKPGNGAPQQGKGQQSGGQGPSQPGPGRPGCGSCGGAATGIRCEADNDPAARDDADLVVAVEAAREKMSQAKQRGKLPGAWRMLVPDAPFTAPVVDWRQKLRTALRSACKAVAGATIQRFDAPARKQAGIGYGAGIPVLARNRATVPSVAVVLDTSGSMIADIPDALAEIKGVLLSLGGETVRFFATDTRVAAEVKTRDLAKIVASVAGGGGTDFRAVFERIEELRGKDRPQVVVFLTDGYATFPHAPPRGVRVIWVLVGSYTSRPPWGEIIDATKLILARC